jgi:hypothetical protein
MHRRNEHVIKPLSAKSEGKIPLSRITDSGKTLLNGSSRCRV